LAGLLVRPARVRCLMGGNPIWKGANHTTSSENLGSVLVTVQAKRRKLGSRAIGRI